ncbi:MAG TPA: M1 family aminopeptidase [Terriglobales bacterium]|nr:M1 family aminopeptidase [Terriglobales bacterium]
MTRGPAPLVLVVVVLGFATLAAAQSAGQAPPQPAPGSVQDLYRQLRTASLNPSQVFKIRDAAIDREDLHLYLNDGIIGFTQTVNGRITGAYFTGEGEILARPPNVSERASLGLFTGLGFLDEHFQAAYLRFNDDTAMRLQANLRDIDPDAKQEFLAANSDIAPRLAGMDAMRLLSSFTSHYPSDRYLHVRMLAARLGGFDAFYDSMAEEQISIGKFTTKENNDYYDVWMSFPGQASRGADAADRMIDPWRSWESVRVTKFAIKARLIPPERIESDATLSLTAKYGGERLLFFELSRYLKVSSITLGGKPLEFLQNESVDGTELAKRGNDLVAVIFPQPLKDGEQFQLHFEYAGAVMQQAGPGLLYVGARGTWYPNRGVAMSKFDLEFRWPTEWTLVATGKRVSLETQGNELVGRWVSEVEMPLAGFNLGQYTRKEFRTGNVEVDAYASSSLESELANQTATTIILKPPPKLTPESPETVIVAPPLTINPAESGGSMAERCAKAIDAYSQWFGPYPYSSLAVTQFPSRSAQGWPGLIFLSSAAWLPPEEQARLKLDPYGRIVYGDLMPWHETAHMWWGDVVFWKSYRDQWLVEALSNYSALMMIERRDPETFELAMNHYRDDLLNRAPNGRQYLDAGPVNLGVRLSSSEFPNGYVVISYGRGTWLIHMLRSMFDDPSPKPGQHEDLFLQALRAFRERYAFKEATTSDLERVFQDFLPASLRYEGRRSLDWFFEGWVNGTSIPNLSIKDVKISRQGARWLANFTILQQDAPEDLVTSIPIYAVLGENRRTFAGRVFADGNVTKSRLSVPVGTRKLILDPLNTILRRP